MKYDKVLLIGTGKVASECLKEIQRYCEANKIICIEAEYSPFSIVKTICKKNSIQYLHMGNKCELNEYLLEIQKNTVIISAHNSYIFSREIIEKKNIKIINFHNAYLPNYKGRNAPTWCIFNMERFSGATWHEVTENIDEGNIIVQEKIPIKSNATAIDILTACMQAGILLFKKNVDKFLNDEYQSFSQSMDKGNLYYAKDIPNDGYLDITWSIEKISAFLRAMDYGSLDILPKIKIIVLNKAYYITSYTIEKIDCSKYEKIQFESNKIIFVEEKLIVQCELERICNE